MAYVFQTFDENGKAHPKWKFRIVDWDGRRKTSTGTTSEPETKRMALQAEARAARIKAGLEAPPTSSFKHRHRPYDEVKDEYLAWGKAQGGRGGRAWSSQHADKREKMLAWWKERLGLDTLIDLDGILPRVEEALRELQPTHAGRTLQNHAEALRSFCRWCVTRGFLAVDPLRGLAPFSTEPQTIRRALTLKEIKALLEAAPEERRLVYEAAFCSGLRRNELRSLSVEDLDVEGGGLHLHAEWTKNRKPGFQPLPAALAQRLKAFIKTGKAADLYRTFLRRKDCTLQVPENPLLYVPSHAAREFDRDCKVAKIKKNAPGGKVDFHSCRVAYVSLVLESGAGVKEAQSLARHGTPTLTMNTYGRTRQSRLSELAEAVGNAVLTAEPKAESTATAQLMPRRKAAGAENAYVPSAFDAGRLVEDRGFESTPSPP